MVAKSAAIACDNANDYTSYDVGMCLKWVRTCWEIGSFYGSAIEAWNGAKYKHPGDRNPPKGAPVFYRGGSYGHIVIANGGPIRSTDCQSSGRVSNAALAWPETAWGDTYLGWTEDLNGVRLPLSTTPPKDDDMPQYDHAVQNKSLKLKAGEWSGVTWDKVAAGPATKPGEPAISIGGRTYSAVVACAFDAPEGATIRMRFIERQDGADVETGPQTETVATSGKSFPTHPAAGTVGKGRTLRLRVFCSAAATLTSTDLVVLSW
jgi:hypothetical protein